MRILKFAGNFKVLQNSFLAFLAFLALLAFAGLVGCKPTPYAAETVRIEIDPGKKSQRIDGFGGTIGWIYPPKEQRQKVADLLFKDLGVSILRMSALSRNNDTDDEGSPEQVNDNDTAARINWDGFDFPACEGQQLALALLASKRGVKDFVAASWSPPGWMKTNDSRCNGGHLKEGMNAEFAELWSAYLLWMKRGKISIKALSLQNEPAVPRFYPTAEFSPQELNKLAEAVLKRTRKEGFKARLLYPEVSQLERMQRYLKAASPATLAGVRALSLHAYDLSVDYYDVEAYRQKWRKVRKVVAPYKKALWMTEFSNYSGALSGRNPGSWPEALAWARHLHLALVEGHCSAVLFWGLYFDKKGEALIYARDSRAQEFEITPKFYTSRNYFKFIRPGAVRVAGSAGSSVLEVSAFWHQQRKEFVAVLINPGRGELKASLAIKGQLQPVSLDIYRTSKEEKCIKLPPAAKKKIANRYLLSFPAQSVTTLVFKYRR
jgi:glucuronoarabinoxylan endo-1,4-beta-xylanase